MSFVAKIFHHKGDVLIVFDEPVMRLELTAASAIEFARVLEQEAREATPIEATHPAPPKPQ